MSLSLYEIDAELLKIGEEVYEVFDDETGEVSDIDRFEELKKRLDELTEARDDKISNIACWYKSLLAEAEAIKAEKMALAKRQKSCENKAESLKKYLDYALQGKKFSDSRCNITYRKSKSVVVDPDLDPFNLPIQFQKVTIEPNKVELKKAIEGGQIVEGVEIVEKNSIQIK